MIPADIPPWKIKFSSSFIRNPY